MTVMTEATGTEPTVDSVMGQILVELGSSVGLLLSALGMRTGLWAALAEAGPLTPRELSERTGSSRPTGTGMAAGAGRGGISSLRSTLGAIHVAGRGGGGDVAGARRRDDRRVHEHVVLDGRRLR